MVFYDWLCRTIRGQNMKITITYRINSNCTKEKYVIAVLHSADDLLSCTDLIKEGSLHTENISLYKYSDNYVILFPYSVGIGKKIFYLKEFGKIKYVCESTVSHIKEYGTLICDNLMLLLK